MKYNNINSTLNPFDDELNKKHAQYEEFRDALSNESIFNQKPQGYVTLKKNFPLIDWEDWAALILMVITSNTKSVNSRLLLKMKMSLLY